MAYAIAITKPSQEFLATLNEGVVPQIEDPRTFFIIHGGETPNEIVTRSEMIQRYGTSYVTLELTVHVVND